MTITVNVGDATVKNVVKILYDLVLNDIKTAEIYTDGSDSTLQAEYDTQKVVEIYRNGTLEFKGEVIQKENTQGGGIILYCIGQEEELTETDAPVTGSTHSQVWLATSDNTIINTIITTASGWSCDVTGSTAATLDSFKVTDSMSVWNALQKWKSTTGKDFYIVDSTKTVYVTDAKNRTDKAVFNEGSNCGNISFRKSKPEATKVLVYGKGDGDDQIVGTAGSGTPVKKITDRSVFTQAEANTRATAELGKIVNAIYNYTFNCYNSNEDVETGDTIIINAPSAGLFNTSADIVKIQRRLINDTEKLSIEVSDTTSRKATQNNTKVMYKLANNYEISQSSMQGSGNLSQWSNQINSGLNNPFTIPFYIGSRFEDEAGSLMINSFTVDYDVDPYRAMFGTATDSGHLHDLNPGSTDSHKHDAADSGHDHGLPTITSGINSITMSSDTDSWSSSTSASWTNVSNVTLASGTYGMIYFYIEIEDNGTSGADTITARVTSSYASHILYTPIMSYNSAKDKIIIVMPYPVFASHNSVTYTLYLSSDSANPYKGNFKVYGIKGHTHAISGYNADSDNAAVSDANKTPGLAGDSDSSTASVTIGDGVSDAGSLNATSVSIYLDKWNTGTLAWDNIHSVVNTGKTLDTDVDMSSSGTYPNSTGWWRIRILTNHTDPDLVKAIINLKHKLEN